MLIRQKTILALLLQANKQLSPTVFVKLVFLLRHETEIGKDLTFYDFVPYKYGPFSFALYRELSHMRRDGYVTPDEERVALNENTISLAAQRINELPATVREAVGKVVRRYLGKSQLQILEDVYVRYPWYTINSGLTNLRPKLDFGRNPVLPAVYTAGYEGKSVDAFFDHLLKKGIRLIIDVRANPISRRYGFSKGQFSEIAKRLGFGYQHMPRLGVPSKYRVHLSDVDSYQRLLTMYEQEMLPRLVNEIDEVGELMKGTPAVLMCVERDIRFCHRSRLANAVSRNTGLKVNHM